MKTSMHIVVLRTIKHSDKHSILTAYSLEAGRVAFAVPAGVGKSASRMRALLMPLSLVECVADMKPGREVHQMRELRPLVALHGLHSHPVKSAVALFVAELLGILLREGPADAALYDYVSQSVQTLDVMTPDRVANFHLCFLYGLGRFLGIEPDIDSFSEGRVFDFVDGRFRVTAPMHSHFLMPQESAAVAALARMTYANMHLFRMSRSQRNDLLDGILRYYSMHYAALEGLKSLDVLRVLF